MTILHQIWFDFAPGGVNKNVRVPNQKRAIYQVVVPGADGEKEWEHQAKGDAKISLKIL